VKKAALTLALITVVASGAALASGTVDQTSAVRRTQALEVVMEADRSTYAPGEHIRLRLSVRNVSAQPVTLEFPTSQQFDFIVRSEAGAEIARWSQGRQFTQQGLRLTVEPNQRVTIGDAVWRQRDQNDRLVPPGRYYIIGVVTSRPQPAPVTIVFTKAQADTP
jgi:hypothetical protein